MSRIGKKPIDIPKEVKVGLANGIVTVEGPKGKVEYKLPVGFTVETKDGKILVARPSDIKADKAKHGLIRSLINNMLIGVTKGYVKELEISGVGFKASVQGKSLSLTLSRTHPIDYKIPDGITIETPKPINIIIKGTDKCKVGEVAAEIRGYYEPEPYKGKGINTPVNLSRERPVRLLLGLPAEGLR